MRDIAIEEITTHIELLTNQGDLIFTAGLIEMAYSLKAINEEERAEFINKAHDKLVEATKNKHKGVE